MNGGDMPTTMRRIAYTLSSVSGLLAAANRDAGWWIRVIAGEVG